MDNSSSGNLNLELILAQDKSIASFRAGLDQANSLLLELWKRTLSFSSDEISMQVSDMNFDSGAIIIDSKIPPTNEVAAQYVLIRSCNPGVKYNLNVAKTKSMKDLPEILINAVGKLLNLPHKRHKGRGVSQDFIDSNFKLEKVVEGQQTERRTSTYKPKAIFYEKYGLRKVSESFTDLPVYKSYFANGVTQNIPVTVVGSRNPKLLATYFDADNKEVPVWIWEKKGNLFVKATDKKCVIDEKVVASLAAFLGLREKHARKNSDIFKLENVLLSETRATTTRVYTSWRDNLAKVDESDFYNRRFANLELPVRFLGYSRKKDKLCATTGDQEVLISTKGNKILVEPVNKKEILEERIVSELATVLNLQFKVLRKRSGKYLIYEQKDTPQVKRKYTRKTDSVDEPIIVDAKDHPLYKKLSNVKGVNITGQNSLDNSLLLTLDVGGKYKVVSSEGIVKFEAFAHVEKQDDEIIGSLENALGLMAKRTRGRSASFGLVARAESTQKIHHNVIGTAKYQTQKVSGLEYFMSILLSYQGGRITANSIQNQSDRQRIVTIEEGKKSTKYLVFWDPKSYRILVASASESKTLPKDIVSYLTSELSNNARHSTTNNQTWFFKEGYLPKLIASSPARSLELEKAVVAAKPEKSASHDELKMRSLVSGMFGVKFVLYEEEKRRAILRTTVDDTEYKFGLVSNSEGYIATIISTEQGSKLPKVVLDKVGGGLGKIASNPSPQHPNTWVYNEQITAYRSRISSIASTGFKPQSDLTRRFMKYVKSSS